MEKVIKLHSNREAQRLFGRNDENARLITKELEVKISIRDGDLVLNGDEPKVKEALGLFSQLLELLRDHQEIKRQDVIYALKTLKADETLSKPNFILEKIEIAAKKQFVSPKTKGQREYVEAIKNYDIVFGIGPAGTGKTYLAMAMAVSALKKGKVRRIILTRPAIEAGESLGFLPGDLSEKIGPYLRPLYDALYDMMEVDRIEKYLEMGVIEVAPLAYMRGRTLNDAFIILDEAQNCTSEQMKMFLTRLGFDSKTVITGDITQSDLPGGKPTGLLRAKELLENIFGIKFIYFTGRDVVRHELVQQIIEAYEKSTTK